MTQCAHCEKTFTSDQTPMADMAVCLMCRPNVTVQCAHCGNDCPGSYDGQLACRDCRKAEYFKKWLYADTTGGRLWRLTTARFTPDW